MFRWTMFGRNVSLCVAALLAVAALRAQDSRGTITGTVRDMQGAAIAAATVVVTSTGTNQALRLVTRAAISRRRC
ncbi:MAG: hypothetical protein JNL62_11765 [Bryobacterales bacterium]|nr:hypothetical protein [Bryobacterales bacterium]